jgi:hypothetical protein
MHSGSTTLITKELPDGTIQELTSKSEMEQVIMASNLEKFRQSHRNAFYNLPLSQDLGFKATTTGVSAVLAGVYEASQPIPENCKLLLDQL